MEKERKLEILEIGEDKLPVLTGRSMSEVRNVRVTWGGVVKGV